MDAAGKDGGSAPPAAHRPDSWGLLPDVQWQRLSWRELLHYWFVQFNPLYFISAMCILFGVFLVARNIETLAPKSPERVQLVLFAVIQAYEWLLIGGAALLAQRARVVRPAVILALLEAVFLFDCTFRLESIVFIGPLAYWLTAAWFLLTLLKVRLLAVALRLRLPGRVLAAVGASALGIVVAIHWLSQPGTDKLLVLQLAAWYGTLVMVLLAKRLPAIPSVFAVSEPQVLMAYRCIRGGFRLLVGFYFYHLWSYILLAAGPEVTGPAILPQAGAFLLLQVALRPRDVDIWKFAVLTFGAALPAPSAVPYSALLLAAVLGYRVWGGARSSLAVAAALAAYTGAWLFGMTSWSDPLPRLPALLSWQNVGLAAALAAIAWRLRDPLALAAIASGVVYLGYRHGASWLPESELAWGILLLAVGFIALGAGIAINWWFRGKAPPTAAASAADVPGASAAESDRADR